MAADRTGFHTVSVQKDTDGVRHVSGKAEVMGDHENGHTGLVSQPEQFVCHLLLGRDVQRGGHFVTEEQPGPQKHEQCDRDSLTHAAADLVRTARQDAPVGGQAQRLEHMEDFMLIEFLPVALQGLLKLHAEGPERVEGGRRVLCDQSDLISEKVSTFPVAHREDILPGKGHTATGHFGGVGCEPQKGFQNRGFSGTGFSGNAVDLPRSQFQTVAVQRLIVAVRHPQAFHREQALFPRRWTGCDGPDRFDLFRHSHHFASLTSE